MWAPFIKRITKIDGTTIDDAEDLNFAMSMYNLLEYSLNYSETIGSLRFYSKDILMQTLLLIMILNLSTIRLN